MRAITEELMKYARAVERVTLCEENLRLSQDEDRDDATGELKAASRDAEEARQDVERLIQRLDDSRQVFVMRFRYIRLHPVLRMGRPKSFRMLTWREVADSMSYSVPQVKRFHAQAIRKLEMEKG